MGLRYHFADFVFDRETGLWRGGEQVPLEPLAHELLHHLLENRGRIVTRDELQEHLWDGRIVSDAAISTQIRTLRRALGDDRARQRFVRTYPRRGFRFSAPVEPAPPGGSGQRRRAPLRAVALGLALLAGGMLALWPERGNGPETAPEPPALSIAVLPFDNLSGDSSRDYLADAFTEDLITDLSRIRDAFVISRSTTFTYRDTQSDAAPIARELGVRYVLEGSLRVEDGRVRINAQLIDGRNDGHLWAERYDLPLAELFDVKHNVTGRIASVLRAELRVTESARQDPQPGRAAWEHALRGNVILFSHETVADYQQAYDHLTRAVRLDPGISSAWGGLAFIHFAASLAPIPEISRPDSAALSLEAARKAVQADPMNAEPYWLLGAGHARTGEPERGMTACETALALNPNMDCGHVCAGLVHLASGEPERAVPFFRHALALNPRFRPFTKEKYLGLAHIQSGRDDLAIAALNRALAAAPMDMFANLALGAALALDGRVSEARAVLQDYARRDGQPAPTISALRESMGWMGPKTERMFDGLRKAGLPEA